MEQFILGQWVMGKIGAEKVRSYAPKWITTEQAETILTTSQAIVD